MPIRWSRSPLKRLINYSKTFVLYLKNSTLNLSDFRYTRCNLGESNNKYCLFIKQNIILKCDTNYININDSNVNCKTVGLMECALT